MAAQSGRSHPLPIMALALLMLPFLTGCAMRSLSESARTLRSFKGIRVAYVWHDELRLVYTEAGDFGRRDRTASFPLDTLRARPVGGQAPLVPQEATKPGHAELPPSPVPRDAQPVPVLCQEWREEPMSLPPGARFAVYWRRSDEDYRVVRTQIASDGYRAAWHWSSDRLYAEGHVLIAREDGTVTDQQMQLPLSEYVAWFYYPALPLALAFDVVTLPLGLTSQLCSCGHSGWWPRD